MPPSTAAVIDKKTSTVSKSAKAKSKEVCFLPQASTSNAGLDRTDAEEIEAAVEAQDDEDEEMEIDPSSLLVPIVAPQAEAAAMETDQHPLSFPALSSHHTKQTTQERRIPIPPHRLTPLKKDWVKIYTPLVEECGLQIRMNTKKRSVELKTSKHTPSPANTILQKAADFLAAYALGFQAEDAIALVRMDDLYIESFEIKDVKTLHGDHLSRAIGRIAGQNGKTRYTIENVSRTRIVLADSKIHILGTFGSIKVARDAVCALILGSPPGKVYNNLRNVGARMKQRSGF